MKFLELSGGQRKASTNTALQQAFGRHVRRGRRWRYSRELVGCRSSIPTMKRQRRTAQPKCFAEFARDGVIISSPEYPAAVLPSLISAGTERPDYITLMR